MRDIHFSSRSEEWATPDELFAELNSVFRFGLDACATPENAKCDRYITKEQDALRQDWTDAAAVWMNPPYGRKIPDFMRKAYETSLAGPTVVCLVPARTCTAWWHDWAKRGTVILLRRRLRFVGPGGVRHAAPFPSAVVIFFGGRLGDAVRP